jgi:hypothetical protein
MAQALLKQRGMPAVF